MARRKTALLSDQIYDALAKRILSGEFREGELLPSERELIQEYDISRPTIRKALNRLGREGALACRPGIGYTVQKREKKKDRRSDVPMVGLIVNMPGDPETGGIKILIRQFSDAGYSVLVGVSDQDVVRENECVDRFLKAGVGGLVVIPATAGSEPSRLTDLIQERFPLVALGQPRGWKIPARIVNMASVVDVDNTLVIDIALAHLFELGHRRIGFVMDMPLLGAVKTIRERRYDEVLEERGLKVREDWKLTVAANLLNSGESELRAMLSRPGERPTALACARDDVAVHTVHLLQKMGLAVPRDISVTGVGFQESGERHVTSVCYPAEQYAAEVVRSLLDQISGKAPNRRTLLIPELVVRETTSAPRD